MQEVPRAVEAEPSDPSGASQPPWAVLTLEHSDVEARSPQLQRGAQPREAGSQYNDPGHAADPSAADRTAPAWRATFDSAAQ